MTKYRAITDGKTFRIQFRFDYWPFWTIHEEIRENKNGRYFQVMEYSTEEAARNEIEGFKIEDRTEKKKIKWRVI